MVKVKFKFKTNYKVIELKIDKSLIQTFRETGNTGSIKSTLPKHWSGRILK